jgi:hypothetical protein
MTNVDNIVSILDSIGQASSLSFYVPSLQKEAMFKPITTGQQKNLLKAAIDNPVFQTRFIIATYNILAENCIDKEVLAKLNILDWAAIMIQYRVNIYGPVHTVSSAGKQYNVNLQECVERFKTVTCPSDILIAQGDISLMVGVPSLLDQYTLEKQLRERFMDDTELATKGANISDALGDAFVGEMSKYLKSVTLTVKGADTDINYKSLTFAKKHLVLEKLPAVLVKEMVSFVSQVTSLQRNALHVVGTNLLEFTTTEVDISIDATLFPVE